MRLSEYVEYDDIGALVQTGKVTPAKSMFLARDAHHEVNPRINVVIEFYEDAALVDLRTSFFGAPFLRKKLRASEAGRFQKKGSRQFYGNRFSTDSFLFRRARVARFLGMPHFSAFVVVRGDRILYEAYAPDFRPDRPHTIVSITKTTLNLMLGRAVADGLVNLDERVGTYLPEIGTGYGEATVKAVADMNVVNVDHPAAGGLLYS